MVGPPESAVIRTKLSATQYTALYMHNVPYELYIVVYSRTVKCGTQIYISTEVAAVMLHMYM